MAEKKRELEPKPGGAAKAAMAPVLSNRIPVCDWCGARDYTTDVMVKTNTGWNQLRLCRDCEDANKGT